MIIFSKLPNGFSHDSRKIISCANSCFFFTYFMEKKYPPFFTKIASALIKIVVRWITLENWNKCDVVHSEILLFNFSLTTHNCLNWYVFAQLPFDS